jgi:LysM domain
MFKKSSTAVLLALLLGLSAGWAQQQTGTVLELRPDAPDQYVVQRGDTLWDISAKFLQEPWRWPQIWRLNKDQIRNPHLIYPGNIVRLDRGGLTLSIDRPQPRIREEAVTAEAVPTIPLKVIEPFLSQPLVIERGGLDGAPQIVATQEGRYNIGAGARAYVAGLGDAKDTLWQIYRPGLALVDPETRETLGYEAIFLGTARLMRRGEPSTVQILSSKQEIGEGDRLVIAPQPRIFAYAPRAPEQQISGRIMSIYDGRSYARSDYLSLAPQTPGMGDERSVLYGTRYGETGPLAIVSLNRGAKAGLEPGHVLAIWRSATIVNDRSTGPYYMGAPKREPFQLPEERYGLLMVFRVFENLSYALTLQVERPVEPGDVVRTP